MCVIQKGGGKVDETHTQQGGAQQSPHAASRSFSHVRASDSRPDSSPRLPRPGTGGRGEKRGRGGRGEGARQSDESACIAGWLIGRVGG